MHDEHSPRDSEETRQPRSPEEIEPYLLLRLLDPPQFGDHIRDLALDLGEDQAHIEAAVERLVEAGLAARKGDFVSPTKATIRFNELWPT